MGAASSQLELLLEALVRVLLNMLLSLLVNPPKLVLAMEGVGTVDAFAE